jgi:hypothetical protein
MISHIWSVLCSRSVVDTRSKNVSIQNALEQVNVTGEPAPGQVVPMRMEVVSMWVRTEPEIPAQGKLRVEFHAPSGKVFGQLELPVDLTKHERFRSQVHFDGLPAEEVGRHYFYVNLQEEDEGEWRQVAAVPLTMVFRPPQEKPEEEGETEEAD